MENLSEARNIYGHYYFTPSPGGILFDSFSRPGNICEKQQNLLIFCSIQPQSFAIWEGAEWRQDSKWVDLFLRVICRLCLWSDYLWILSMAFDLHSILLDREIQHHFIQFWLKESCSEMGLVQYWWCLQTEKLGACKRLDHNCFIFMGSDRRTLNHWVGNNFLQVRGR